jgi:inner membrane protein
VETQAAFELLPVDSKSGEVDPHNLAVVRYKPEETPVSLAAKKSWLGRVYLDWAQYPWLETERLEANRYKVRFVDLRYSSAEALRLRRSGPLTGYVIVDSQLRVEAQGTGLPPQ